jgi:hypothetical protein
MWVNQLRWANQPCTAISVLALLIAEPWQGNTIRWVDLATSTRLSRWQMTRITDTTFTVESFAKVGDKTPNYTANCKRD